MHEPFIRDLAFKIVDGQRLEMSIDVAAYYLARAIYDNFNEVGDYHRPTPRQVREAVFPRGGDCPVDHWEPGLGPCVCRGSKHNAETPT